jgi:hypothetical protein
MTHMRTLQVCTHAHTRTHTHTRARTSCGPTAPLTRDPAQLGVLQPALPHALAVSQQPREPPPQRQQRLAAAQQRGHQVEALPPAQARGALLRCARSVGGGRGHAAGMLHALRVVAAVMALVCAWRGQPKGSALLVGSAARGLHTHKTATAPASGEHTLTLLLPGIMPHASSSSCSMCSLSSSGYARP